MGAVWSGRDDGIPPFLHRAQDAQRVLDTFRRALDVGARQLVGAVLVERLEIGRDLAALVVVEARPQLGDDRERAPECFADRCGAGRLRVGEADAAAFEEADRAIVEKLDELLGGGGENRLPLLQR